MRNPFHETVKPHQTDWRDQASCLDANPELWFSHKTVEKRRAKQICGNCPVQTFCKTVSVNEQHGIWAGEEKTGAPKYADCAGGCGKTIRPRNTHPSDHPGTVRDYGRGHCRACWQQNGPTVLASERRPESCASCGRRVRPGRARSIEYPGTIAYHGNGVCKSCYESPHGTVFEGVAA